MKSNKTKFLVFGAIIIGGLSFGIFLYQNNADILHRWMHKPVVTKIMGWAGLSEEILLAGKKVYWCPMHPQVQRDKVGVCPICNMQLVELKEEGKSGKNEGTILLTSNQIQQASVTFATVRQLSFARLIETTGRVELDERRLKTISVWVSGQSRIDALYLNFTGATVLVGEPLASIYNSELITTQEEYLLLLKSKSSKRGSRLETVKTRFNRWGITDQEINKIKKKGKVLESLTIYSPVAGTVIERLVSEGQYVKEGEPLLKLADLSKVWVYGDIYENELSFIRIGLPVEISVQGNTIVGKVDFIDPVVQVDSQTVRVRFDVSNKKGYLKPGMFVSIRIKTPKIKVLAVPESAVLLTGRRAVVMVSEGEGVMRPVEVTLGRKWLYPTDRTKEKKESSFLNGETRYHEVLSGLDEGQRVVSSANFLVTAEAQFQGALKKFTPLLEKGGKTKLPDEIELMFANILGSYEKIRKALVRDNADTAKKEAIHLIEDVDATINKTDSDLKKALTKIKAGARGMAGGASDIEKMRNHFANISQSIILLISRYGLPQGVKLNAFTCPMTENDDAWLQPDKTIENPYMGQRMSTCGIHLSLTDEK